MKFPRQFFIGHISTQDLLVRLLMLSLFLVLQQGCTASSLKPWAPHVTEDVRATILTIGVAVGEELPRRRVLDRYGEAHHLLDVALAEEPPRAPSRASGASRVSVGNCQLREKQSLELVGEMADMDGQRS